MDTHDGIRMSGSHHRECDGLSRKDGGHDVSQSGRYQSCPRENEGHDGGHPEKLEVKMEAYPKLEVNLL
jgi:hypothetical protein